MAYPKLYSGKLLSSTISIGIRLSFSPRLAVYILGACDFFSKVLGAVGRQMTDHIWSPAEAAKHGGYINECGLSRKVGIPNKISALGLDSFYQHIFDSVKHSLERLQLDYIDVLQCARLTDVFAP